ncbi:MAG: 4Fe-4S binding protein, partial [Candidatus Shapirobacteria bacterium]|nr:4Fe-4S binding protein [Candidatus Shapirobacteria bacterium]
IDHNRCLVCGLCTENCPTEAIKKEGDKIIIDYEKCIGCGECVAVCPQKVIEVNKEDLATCQEKTAIYAYALVKNKPSLYLNYLININAVCDCFSSTSPKLMDDLGVLISDDPVAIDQASLDWINQKAGKNLFLKINEVDYQPILDMGEKIGLGSKKYQIIKT